MLAKKTVFIIPGYRQMPTTKAYREVARILTNEGYHPILITIPWRKQTIVEHTEFFLKEYKKVKRREKYILGFSFGAMIAFAASTRVEVSGLILCSLSPYFTEDLSTSPLHCGNLAKEIKAKKIHMLYGSQEARSLVKRVNEAFSLIPTQQKYLFPIQKTDHNIGDKRYLSTIHQIAKELN